MGQDFVRTRYSDIKERALVATNALFLHKTTIIQPTTHTPFPSHPSLFPKCVGPQYALLHIPNSKCRAPSWAVLQNLCAAREKAPKNHSTHLPIHLCMSYNLPINLDRPLPPAQHFLDQIPHDNEMPNRHQDLQDLLHGSARDQ